MEPALFFSSASFSFFFKAGHTVVVLTHRTEIRGHINVKPTNWQYQPYTAEGYFWISCENQTESAVNSTLKEKK